MAADHKVTVIMIAHRLETAVTYSDQILVMDKGTVVEYDHSYNLLVDDPMSTSSSENSDAVPTKNSLFASMVKSLTL